MRAVLQRVKNAELRISGDIHSTIGPGILVLVAFAKEESQEEMVWLINKIRQMRIFSDADGKMNLSVEDVHGELMIVSQFTLFASTKKGNRPSFIHSAPPELAREYYDAFLDASKKVFSGRIVTGEFGADMQINLNNDGPVTILLDTKNKE